MVIFHSYVKLPEGKEDQKKERSTWAADLFPNDDFLVGCNLEPATPALLVTHSKLKVVSLGQLPMIFTTNNGNFRLYPLVI